MNITVHIVVTLQLVLMLQAVWFNQTALDIARSPLFTASEEVYLG